MASYRFFNSSGGIEVCCATTFGTHSLKCIIPLQNAGHCVIWTTCETLLSYLHLAYLTPPQLKGPSLNDLEYSSRQVGNLMQSDFLANSSRFLPWTIVVLERSVDGIPHHHLVVWNETEMNRQGLEPAVSIGIIRAGLHQDQRHPSDIIASSFPGSRGEGWEDQMSSGEVSVRSIGAADFVVSVKEKVVRRGWRVEPAVVFERNASDCKSRQRRSRIPMSSGEQNTEMAALGMVTLTLRHRPNDGKNQTKSLRAFPTLPLSALRMAEGSHSDMTSLMGTTWGRKRAAGASKGVTRFGCLRVGAQCQCRAGWLAGDISRAGSPPSSPLTLTHIATSLPGVAPRRAMPANSPGSLNGLGRRSGRGSQGGSGPWFRDPMPGGGGRPKVLKKIYFLGVWKVGPLVRKGLPLNNMTTVMTRGYHNRDGGAAGA
ncbi:hypothetical protein EDB85DRAFT_2278780, partial [Lactarius pseudohatsudake]